MKQRFDAIVVGAGQAGPSLAQRLGAAGRKVALIERKLMGGTCVNTGCIPTKAMVASAYVAHTGRRAAEYGVGTGDITVMEIGISPCPGDITWGAKAADGGPGTNQQVAGGTYQPCYTKSSFITNVSVAWHLTVSGHYAYCYAPVATGPWYVNVRYTIPGGCTYGQGNCGASFQWNRR